MSALACSVLWDTVGASRESEPLGLLPCWPLEAPERPGLSLCIGRGASLPAVASHKMPAIETFSVRIVTGRGGGPAGKGSGTDGDVYIGMCGREFMIDSGSNDFEEGSDKTYIFGLGNNINHPHENDPRRLYPINTEDIDVQPAYIRFAPDGRDDEWHLRSATVIVNNGQHKLEAFAQPGGGPPDGDLWLGTHMGLYCYLWTTFPTPSPRARARAR
jgi:hypothetical protein